KPALLGTREIAADAENVLVLRVPGACKRDNGPGLASHHPLAAEWEPQEPESRLQIIQTLAVFRASRGNVETQYRAITIILGFAKLGLQPEGLVANVAVVRVAGAAFVRDDEIRVPLELEAPVERHPDRVPAEVPVADVAVDSLVESEHKEPGTEELPVERAYPPLTRGAGTTGRRQHE